MSVSSTGASRSERAVAPSPEDPEPRRSLADRLDEVLLQLDRLRDRPAVSALLAAAAISVALGGWLLSRSMPDEAVEDRIPFVSTTSGPAATTVVTAEVEPVVVHVAGAVNQPGVVILDGDARIIDAIDAAGGPRPDADLHQLNLAAPVSDGMQVRVPIPGEVVPINGTGAAGEPGGLGPVNLNTASAADLERLHGIGPALAASIVDWRRDNGPFTAPDDLLSVPGIGPAKLDALIELVVL